SAAAETCVPVKTELMTQISLLRKQLSAKMTQMLTTLQHELRLVIKGCPTPRALLERQQLLLSDLEDRLCQHAQQRLVLAKHDFEKSLLKLELLSPQNNLKRGYVILKNTRGQPVTRKANTQPGDTVKLVFYDGETPATINQHL
ncbi:MAG: hypothetical protein ACD_62C00383G0001, partial [uncultured bacterium]